MNIDTIYRFFPPPLFLGAESPVNNHYLLNRLPFPSTEWRKGARRGRKSYLGLFFKDLRNGKQGNQLRKNVKYPPPVCKRPPPTYSREVHQHSIIHINCIKRKDKKSGVFRKDAHIFNPLNMFTIHLPILYPSTKLKQLDLLREPSTHLLRRRAFKNDCFNQRREKQQVTDLTAILVCPSLPLFS